MPLPYEHKTGYAFARRVEEIAHDLGTRPEWLMLAMAFETGRTFDPAVRNAAGSGAVGLIQFMPSTARALGTTTAAMAQMTPLEQLEYVRAYLWPYRGRLSTLEDVYMAILWPVAVGKPSDYVLFSHAEHPTTYAQNRGLDTNGDGQISKYEAAAKVREMGDYASEVWLDPVYAGPPFRFDLPDFTFLRLPTSLDDLFSRPPLPDGSISRSGRTTVAGVDMPAWVPAAAGLAAGLALLHVWITNTE